MKLNTNIIQGVGKLLELPKLLTEYGLKRPGIVCDKALAKSVPYVADFIHEMESNGAYLMYYDYPFEPSYQYLDKIMNELNTKTLSNQIDVWIGIGGGSTLDVAKGLAILCKNVGPSITFKGFPKNIITPLPVVAVPSTTGSGSEVTFNASFIDEQNKVKMGINYINNYPIAAILDPNVVMLTPKTVLASSGCDALVHALESFVSTKSTAHTRIFSAHAFRLIMENMPLLLQGCGGIEQWSNMQWAAVFAMFALSNTSSGPAGALSYYLGTHFNVPHGVAGGVFIAKVSRQNYEAGYYDYALLHGWDGCDEAHTERDKSDYVIQAIEKLIMLADIPQSIAALGVKPEDYDGIRQFVTQVPDAFRCNPIAISDKALEAIIV